MEKKGKNIGFKVILIIIAIIAAYFSLSVGIAADNEKIDFLWILLAIFLGFISFGCFFVIFNNKK